MPAPQLSAGETAPCMLQDATPLQSVDLELAVGVHGTMVRLGKLGPAVLAVSDLEYATLGAVVDGLDVERGDKIATEGMSYRHGQTSPHYISFDEQISYLLRQTRRSPYFQASWYPDSYVELGKARQPLLFPPSEKIVDREQNPRVAVRWGAIPQILEDARQLRIIGPFKYARLRAEFRDIHAPCIDSYSVGLKDANYAVSSRKAEILNGHTRNMEIVEGLNLFASQMLERRPANAERPRLVYAVGCSHRGPLSDILERNEIPYSVREFSDGSVENSFVPTGTGLLAGMREWYYWQKVTLGHRAEWKANANAFSLQRIGVQ